MPMSDRQLRRIAALAFPILAFSGQSTVSVMPVAMQDIHKGETLSSVNIASTDAPGPGADGQTVSSPEEVAAYAARGAAKYLGVTVAEARKVLDEQQRFGRSVDQIRARHSAAVSKVYWDFDGGRGVVDMLAGSAPEEVSQVRSLLGPSGRLTQQGRVSEVERGNQAARLSEEIRTAHPGLANLSVLPAGDSEEILVEAPVDVGESVNRWRNKDPGGRSASVRQSLQPNMRAANTGWVVGGGQLNRPSGAAECTSAFTVLNAPAPPKLLTAGHCADDLRYGSYQWLQYASDRVGSYGDLQWHTIYNGGYASPQFQYAPGYLTTNKYSSSVYRNQMVNRYGRMTSETIIVNNPDATVTINNSTLTHVAVTETGSNVDFGDSGGPWWAGASGGATAVGIQSSATYISIGGLVCCRRAVFTPANNLPLIWPGLYYYVG